jgi:RHS repeat-associated protein
MKFTGKERDAETGLDYFGERYFSSAQGRFTSPDALIGKLEWLADPQRWNHYAYVRNNPLRYVDPVGEDLVIYYSYTSDLTDDERKYLKSHEKQIFAQILQKFAKAGVQNVSLRDASTLTKAQTAELNRLAVQGQAPEGVARLFFAGERAPGMKQDAPLSDLGGTDDSKHLSAVFLGRLAKVPAAGCDDACAISDVAAHEIGHAVGFDPISPYNLLDGYRELRGGQRDLMREAQGQPTAPLDFNMSRDKNVRAVQELNRIGDNTPKP